jgi:hypothetical protein
MLGLLQIVELFGELLAEQMRGKRGKWTLVTVIESFKLARFCDVSAVVACFEISGICSELCCDWHCWCRLEVTWW